MSSLCLYKQSIEKKIKKIICAKTKPYIHEYTVFGDNCDDTIEDLKIAFKQRQRQMKEGAIAQVSMGNFYGWKDLKKGHESGLDIMKEDNSIICEIKNKHNTCNSGSLKTVLDKLALYKKKHPDTECVLGIVNPAITCKQLTTSIVHDGKEIKKIQGRDLFKLVFSHEDCDYSEDVIKFVNKLMKDFS